MERTTLGILALAIIATTAPAAVSAIAGPDGQRTAIQRFSVQVRRLDQLIDDLENGRPVDPLEIDRALSAAQI